MQPESSKTLAMSVVREKIDLAEPRRDWAPSKRSFIARAIYDQCVDCAPEFNPAHCEETDCLLHLRWMKGETKKHGLTRLQAIHRYCIWCMGDHTRWIKECTANHCPLYPYRMGHNPRLKGIRRGCTKEKGERSP